MWSKEQLHSGLILRADKLLSKKKNNIVLTMPCFPGYLYRAQNKKGPAMWKSQAERWTAVLDQVPQKHDQRQEIIVEVMKRGVPSEGTSASRVGKEKKANEQKEVWI